MPPFAFLLLTCITLSDVMSTQREISTSPLRIDSVCAIAATHHLFAGALVVDDYHKMTGPIHDSNTSHIAFADDRVSVADNLLLLSISDSTFTSMQTPSMTHVGGVEHVTETYLGRYVVDARMLDEDLGFFQMLWVQNDVKITLQIFSTEASSRVIFNLTKSNSDVHQMMEYKEGVPLHHNLQTISFTIFSDDCSLEIDDRTIFESQRYPIQDLFHGDVRINFQLMVLPIILAENFDAKSSEKRNKNLTDGGSSAIRKISYFPLTSHQLCFKCPGDCQYLWRNTMSCHDRRYFVMADGEPKWSRYHNLWSDNNLEFSTPVGLEIEYHERYCTTDSCRARPYTAGAYYGLQSFTSGRLNATLKSASGRGIVTSIGFVRDPAVSTDAGSEVALHLPSAQNKHAYLRMDRLVFPSTKFQLKKTTSMKQIQIPLETEHSEATNVYTIEWTKSLVRVYRNGALLYSTPDETPFTHMYPFIAVWVSKDEDWDFDSYSSESPHKYPALISEFSYTPLYSNQQNPPIIEIDCSSRSIDSLRAIFIVSIVSTVMLWTIGHRAWRYLKDCARRRIYRPLQQGAQAENETEMTSHVIRQGEDEYEVRVRLAPGQTIDERWTIDFLVRTDTLYIFIFTTSRRMK
eukprot:TRINITY_DN3138_c0_g1_i5.p1 TRINITY_DN3138_c0_g1~~TRINITY_DN3138_c0_g1_i5.p1  ORF type:complete len:632 (-),score=91.95 TRINITY_DN3138_c0_g1_i5:632-2527(-)